MAANKRDVAIRSGHVSAHNGGWDAVGVWQPLPYLHCLLLLYQARVMQGKSGQEVGSNLKSFFEHLQSENPRHKNGRPHLKSPGRPVLLKAIGADTKKPRPLFSGAGRVSSFGAGGHSPHDAG